MSVRYDLPAGVSLRVLSGSGEVTVSAEERSDLEVDPSRHVEFKNGTVEIRSRSGSLSVRCPKLTNISVGVISGHVRLEGEFGSVKVSAVSGSIEIDSAAGDLDVRSVSGHLTVKTCRGRCQLNTKSGHIRVDDVGGATQASTVSGRVEVGIRGGGDVELKTISGSVSVRMLEAKRPRVRFRSLSGRLRCECPQGTDFDLKASTISGSLEVTGP